MAILLSLGQLAVSPATAQNRPDIRAPLAQDSDFVPALNGGQEARRAWIEKQISPDGLRARSAADWRLLLDQIAQHGPFKLVGVRREARWLILSVEVGAAGRHREIRLRPNSALPGQFDDVWDVAWPLTYPKRMDAAAMGEQSLTAALTDRLAFAADHDDFSGAALISHKGRVAYRGAFGYADRKLGRRNTLDTRFNLASAGKMFTTVAIGQLIDAGKLSFDTRLIEVLPDYPNTEAARKITVRHLLNHSAGLGAFFDRPGVSDQTNYSSATDALRHFAAEPLLFEPGLRGQYSNEGFIVLGAIIERLSGMTYYDYVAQHIWRPLHMSRSGFLQAGRPVSNFAHGYSFADTDPLGFGARSATWSPRPPAEGYRGTSAGGSYSTVGDMAAFIEALQAGRLVRRGTLDAMVVRSAVGEEDYGLGFQVRRVKGRTLVGHNGGSTAGTGVNIFFVLETGDSYVLLGNYAPPIAQQLSDDIASTLASLPQ